MGKQASVDGSMKIAFVKKRFVSYGGAERYLQTLISHLAKEGHEIHIISSTWPDMDVMFHRIPIPPGGSLLSAIFFNMKVKQKIKDITPHVVVSFDRTDTQHIYRAAEGCHAEWLHIRSTYEPVHKKLSFQINPFHRYVLSQERKIFTTTPYIVANSHMVKKEIIKHYNVEENKIRVIYNGVDLDRFSPENRSTERIRLRDRLGLDENTSIILFVGSGFKRKGLLTLIKALAMIRNENIHLLVVGKGEKEHCMKIAHRFGIANKISFMGIIEGGIEQIYAGADVFVLPTIYDPFSNATLEAMASGIPVVTTVNNGASEIITPGVEGHIIKDITDLKDISQKIKDCLERQEEMGYRARCRAEQFAIQKAVSEFITLFTKIQEVNDAA